MTDGAAVATGSDERLRGPRRIAPALGLLFLAPLVAEYLLGNVSFSELPALPFLVPMYGGAALLIRELARRTGRGWPTIILLASAYGLFQPAVLDQSLFNPSYMGHDFQSAAHIPALGISASSALTFVVGHAIWSISVPIAIVETMVPHRSITPWLGNVGLRVTGVVFLLGAGLIFTDQQATEHFSAPLWKLVGATAASSAIAGIAFLIGRRPRPRIDRRAPSPRLVGATAFVASSLLNLVPATWFGVAIAIALIAAMTVVITRWSRREGWTAAHRFALAAGASLTYAWLGFVVLPFNDAASTVNLIGQAVLVLAAIALLTGVGRQVRRTSEALSTDGVRGRIRVAGARGSDAGSATL
jgi:hypothetical protein